MWFFKKKEKDNCNKYKRFGYSFYVTRIDDYKFKIECEDTQFELNFLGINKEKGNKFYLSNCFEVVNKDNIISTYEFKGINIMFEVAFKHIYNDIFASENNVKGKLDSIFGEIDKNKGALV